jgi:hypothetical protein
MAMELIQGLGLIFEQVIVSLGLVFLPQNHYLFFG